MSNRHLIFYTEKGTPNLPNDEEFAFIPESKNLAKFIDERLYGVASTVRIGVDCLRKTSAQRRRQIEDGLAANPDNHFVYLLCHGWTNGLQYGYKWKGGAERLAKKIVEHNPDLWGVVLYCCYCAKGGDNFAKQLHTGLMENLSSQYLGERSDPGPFVFGHYYKGHTTKNPLIKIYRGGQEPLIFSHQNRRGYKNILLDEGFPWSEFVRLMRDEDGDLRYFVPLYGL